MPDRLNKFLASAGLGSRRAVEELVRAGRVTVNGQPAGLSARVEDGDEVRLDGERVEAQELACFLLNKPAGVVTTVKDTHGRRTVLELVSSPLRLFPVGRLDRDTTGALLLTNDGGLAHLLMHPSHEVTKTYLAKVAGRPDQAAIERLRSGIPLEDGPTAPAEARLTAADTIELSIHEGRNRQVRRMCKAIGHPVLQLHRSLYAGLGVDDLAPGEWRRLMAEEVAALRNVAGVT
ncbi:MAG: rRNA synthase [Gaiellales bacterium]|nr:rRNA synthase [Gaiellales bacterium]